MKMNRKEIIILSALCLVAAFMDITGLPCVLFRIKIADVDPVIIPLMINFCLIGIVSFFVLRFFRIRYPFGFTSDGLAEGLKKYGLPGIAAGILSFAAFFIGLYPFDYSPSVYKILIEGILYYIGVAIVEEFYVRGLFLNIVESLAYRKENKTVIAILISSLVFGLGHIPGMIGMGIAVIGFKVISTIGMGIYFGTIYKKTNNIWGPIIMHALIDICALPYCFTRNMQYEPVSLVILIITYTALALYCCLILRNSEKER